MFRRLKGNSCCMRWGKERREYKLIWGECSGSICVQAIRRVIFNVNNSQLRLPELAELGEGCVWHSHGNLKLSEISYALLH